MHSRRAHARMAASAGVSVLAEELLLYIMAFLSPADLCRAAAVCRAWRRLANDSSLWRLQFMTRWDAALLADDSPDWRRLFARYWLADMVWFERVRAPQAVLMTPEQRNSTASVYAVRMVLAMPASERMILCEVGPHGSRLLVYAWPPMAHSKREPIGSLVLKAPVGALVATRNEHLLLGSAGSVVLVKLTSRGHGAAARVAFARLGATTLHVESVTALALAEQEDLLVTGSADATVAVCRASTCALQRRIEPRRGAVYCMALAAQGASLLVGTEDGAVSEWAIGTGRLVRVLLHCASLATAMQLGSDNDALFVAAGTAVHRLSLASGAVVYSCALPDAALALAADAHKIVVGTGRGGVTVFRTRDGECEWAFAPHADDVSALCVYAPHGPGADEHLVVASFSGDVRRYRFAGGAVD